MRRTVILTLCLLLAGCEDDDGPINRVVVPGEIVFEKPSGGMDLGAFQRVYFDSENPVAMFFVGDDRSMSAQFVDENGLVDATRLLSSDERSKREAEDMAAKASDGANSILARSALPDRGFQIAPAQGGFLLSYRYGKLSYVTYAAQTRDRFKLGAAIDLTLLAKLAKAAGADNAFRTLPRIGDIKGEKPGRLLLFTSAPPQLGEILSDNAAALFLEVAQADGGWKELNVPAPKSLSDNAAIAAIQEKVKALPPPGGMTTDATEPVS